MLLVLTLSAIYAQVMLGYVWLKQIELRELLRRDDARTAAMGPEPVVVERRQMGGTVLKLNAYRSRPRMCPEVDR